MQVFWGVFFEGGGGESELMAVPHPSQERCIQPASSDNAAAGTDKLMRSHLSLHTTWLATTKLTTHSGGGCRRIYGQHFAAKDEFSAQLGFFFLLVINSFS